MEKGWCFFFAIITTIFIEEDSETIINGGMDPIQEINWVAMLEEEV